MRNVRSSQTAGCVCVIFQCLPANVNGGWESEPTQLYVTSGESSSLQVKQTVFTGSRRHIFPYVFLLSLPRKTDVKSEKLL